MFLLLNEKVECVATNTKLGMHSSAACRICSLISNYNVTLSAVFYNKHEQKQLFEDSKQ